MYSRVPLTFFFKAPQHLCSGKLNDKSTRANKGTCCSSSQWMGPRLSAISCCCAGLQLPWFNWLHWASPLGLRRWRKWWWKTRQMRKTHFGYLLPGVPRYLPLHCLRPRLQTHRPWHGPVDKTNSAPERKSESLKGVSFSSLWRKFLRIRLSRILPSLVRKIFDTAVHLDSTDLM